MYPVLIKYGDFAIYTYGFFIALGFLAGMSVGKTEAKRIGLDPGKIMDFAFYVLIAAIICSRLFYVITAPEKFLDDPVEIFRIWNGGLVFYGGFIGAVAVGIIYLKKHKMPLWKTADLAAPSVAIGHFFGRIGCFFAGCCHGRECDLPWAVVFTHPKTLALPGIPLHPTQLYSAFSNLTIFGLLWFFRTRTRFDGQLFWSYVFVYGIARSIIETFRGDDRGGLLFEMLSVSQTIGLSMSVVAVVMLAILVKKADGENK